LGSLGVYIIHTLMRPYISVSLKETLANLVVSLEWVMLVLRLPLDTVGYTFADRKLTLCVRCFYTLTIHYFIEQLNVIIILSTRLVFR